MFTLIPVVDGQRWNVLVVDLDRHHLLRPRWLVLQHSGFGGKFIQWWDGGGGGGYVQVCKLDGTFSQTVHK